MKKTVAMILTLVLVCLPITACSGQNGTNTSNTKTLKIWSFTDEMETMVNDYYLVDNPDLDYKIEVTIIPTDSYQSKLDPALQAGGSDAPDIFCIEADYAKKYIDSSYTMTIDELGITEADLSDIIDYVKDVARDEDGVIKGVAWQACPGAFFYRRSLAEEYLGVSEPEEVQEYLKDWDSFLDTARLINQKSDGEVKMLTNAKEISTIYLANRDQGWVVNENGQERFVIDPVLYEYLDMTMTLNSESLAFETEGWSEGWYAEMNKDNVFGYVLPTWGLHYILKNNAYNSETGETTAGDWGVIQGPGEYFRGGTWIAGRSGTEMSEEAADFIKYISTNEDFLARWATDTGDFLANKKVVDNIKDDFSEEFLNGQNHYAAFSKMTDNIDASILSGADLTINTFFSEETNAYMKKEKDLGTAINDLTKNVLNAYPNLITE